MHFNVNFNNVLFILIIVHFVGECTLHISKMCGATLNKFVTFSVHCLDFEQKSARRPASLSKV